MKEYVMVNDSDRNIRYKLAATDYVTALEEALASAGWNVIPYNEEDTI